MTTPRKDHLLLLAALLLASSCRDSTEPLQPDTSAAANASDALSGDASDRNPHFLWLTPLRPTPPDAALGEFEALAAPRVDVVCLESSQVSPCDPDAPLASFDRENGLMVDIDHFKVEYPARGLTVSTRNGYTTYRVLVYTDPLVDFGGPFLLGFADFRVVKASDAPKSPPEGITLVQDGRSMPIRFRIDRGAYEHELRSNLATGSLDPEDGALCQERCSVTIVEPQETTTATLGEDGLEVTAIRFEPGDLAVTSVLVIDERTTDGAAANCATGVTLDKKYCYRYRITPDVPFENPVAFGICPREIPLDEDSPWRLLKVDYDEDGIPLVTRPEEADVSEFLPCTPPAGVSLLQRALRFASRWVAAPLSALATTRPWGGMAKDLSDLFWAIDAELQPVSELTGTSAAGVVVPITVRVRSTYLDAGLSGQLVTFTATRGSVSAASAVTDPSGEATVNWTPDNGVDTLLVNAPLALGGPLRFVRNVLGSGVQLGDVFLSPTTMALCTETSGPGGCGSAYSATLTNATGTTIGPPVGAAYPRVVVQMWVEQDAARRAAGGWVLLGCGAMGSLDAGSCELNSTIAPNNAYAGTGVLGAGSAVAVIQVLLQEESGATELLAEAREAVTLTVCTGGIAFTSYRDGNGEIYVMNSDGTSPLRITANAAEDLNPAWAPNGHKLAFSSNRDQGWDIYGLTVFMAPAAGATNLTRSPDRQDFSPAWSPDSQRIAFTSDFQIYVMDMLDFNSSNHRNLTDDPLRTDDHAAWSPDGESIAFTSYFAGIPDILVMAADGSNRRRLTDNNASGAWDEAPAWSPDGRRIAFVSSRAVPHSPFANTPPEFDVYVMDADGGNVQRVTTGAHVFRSPPSWSPNGTMLAFSDGSRVYVVFTDGSNLTALTDAGSANREVSWLTCR